MQATVSAPAARTTSRIVRGLLTPRAARITAPLVFLAAWQVIAPLIPSRILPMPAEVFEAMREQVSDGALAGSFSISIGRLALGFAVALVVGCVVGLAMGMSPRIGAMLHDFVVVGLTIPYLIWGLLVAMWFGPARLGPVLVVIIAATPYVILNMSEGVRDVSKELRDMAAAYGVSRQRVIRQLIFPSLSPFLFASMRYGLANGWKGLVLAEVFAGTSGAGYRINEMREYGDFAGVVGFALWFALFSILVERLVFGRLSRRVFRWRPATAGEVSEPEIAQ